MALRTFLVIGLLLASAGAALAHVHVTVGDGAYELTVGWRNEPVYVGLPNGLDLKVERVAHVDAADPHDEEEDHAHGAHDHERDAREDVLGAHENLTVRYEYGGKVFEPVDFRPAFGRPGWYTADITPTRPGVYTVHVSGTIEGVAVDVRVTPHEVDDLERTSFPESDPAHFELAREVADLEARLARLEAGTQTQIRDAPDAEDVSRDTPAPAAVLVVALALIGAVVLRRRA